MEVIERPARVALAPPVPAHAPATPSFALKRLIDAVIAFCALVLLLPVLVVLAVVIRLSSPGPVLFTQRRLGLDGRLFTMYKFRSMYVDAEDRLQVLLDADPALRLEYGRFHKLLVDPRVTPAGRWMRKYSLDELPQFFNVLRGEMSLVGPRPYLPRELANMMPYAPRILSVRPGLTGLWQTSGRNALSFRDRLVLDARYVDSWSMRADARMVYDTLPVILSGNGAA